MNLNRINRRQTRIFVCPRDQPKAVRALGTIGGYPTEAQLKEYSKNIRGGRVPKRMFVEIMEARVADFQRKGGQSKFKS